MYCLEVHNLRKKYKKVEAVKGVSFKIKKGVCLGLLGPNGAGKSTLMEVLEGIKNPTSGKILYNGKPRNSQYKDKIGIQFQFTALQDYMLVQEALELFASFYKNPYPISSIIKMCQLEDILYRDHRFLSGGQRKRLLLGLAFINKPELIFLDEPTTGLDPVSRREFWNLVKTLKKQGSTIILSTHYMDEIAFLCDEMILLNEGKIFEQGNPHTLLNSYFKGTKVAFPLSYKNILTKQFKGPYEEKEGFIEFQIENVKLFLQNLVSKNLSIEGMEIRSYTLDDLFIHLTGKSLKNSNNEFSK